MLNLENSLILQIKQFRILNSASPAAIRTIKIALDIITKSIFLFKFKINMKPLFIKIMRKKPHFSFFYALGITISKIHVKFCLIP